MDPVRSPRVPTSTVDAIEADTTPVVKRSIAFASATVKSLVIVIFSSPKFETPAEAYRVAISVFDPVNSVIELASTATVVALSIAIKSLALLPVASPDPITIV